MGLPHKLELPLASLAVELTPYAAALDRKFASLMRRSHTDQRVVAALTLVTPGAAVRLIQQGGTALQFFQQGTSAVAEMAQFSGCSQAGGQALQQDDWLRRP